MLVCLSSHLLLMQQFSHILSSIEPLLQVWPDTRCWGTCYAQQQKWTNQYHYREVHVTTSYPWQVVDHVNVAELITLSIKVLDLLKSRRNKLICGDMWRSQNDDWVSSTWFPNETTSDALQIVPLLVILWWNPITCVFWLVCKFYVANNIQFIFCVINGILFKLWKLNTVDRRYFHGWFFHTNSNMSSEFHYWNNNTTTVMVF
jgi:hypothetical protein